MKVYILYYRNWDEYQLLEVFATKESAETYMSIASNCRDYTDGSLHIMEKDLL